MHAPIIRIQTGLVTVATGRRNLLPAAEPCRPARPVNRFNHTLQPSAWRRVPEPGRRGGGSCKDCVPIWDIARCLGWNDKSHYDSNAGLPRSMASSIFTPVLCDTPTALVRDGVVSQCRVRRLELLQVIRRKPQVVLYFLTSAVRSVHGDQRATFGSRYSTVACWVETRTEILWP